MVVAMNRSVIMDMAPYSLVKTDVSTDGIASIFRIKIICERGQV
jgi:hypothetical protein